MEQNHNKLLHWACFGIAGIHALDAEWWIFLQGSGSPCCGAAQLCFWSGGSWDSTMSAVMTEMFFPQSSSSWNLVNNRTIRISSKQISSSFLVHGENLKTWSLQAKKKINIYIYIFRGGKNERKHFKLISWHLAHHRAVSWVSDCSCCLWEVHRLVKTSIS